MDYKLYDISDRDIDQSDLLNYVQMSVAKFNHLYGGLTHATEFYYLYNFFTVASCNRNVYKLYLSLVDSIRDYLGKQDNVWMQTWMNVHRESEVLKSHSHEYAYHGYVSLSSHNTNTVFTDGEDGNEMYKIRNLPMQIYIGPGYRHHHVEVIDSFDDERITLGFDLQLTDTVTENFSFIPVVL